MPLSNPNDFIPIDLFLWKLSETEIELNNHIDLSLRAWGPDPRMQYKIRHWLRLARF